jgi:predicted DCC family thiol-disulfide oxidoreductase YuxK
VDALRARLRSNIAARRFVRWDQAEATDPYAGWPVRLVRVLFALVYLSAFVTKLNLDGDGVFRWANGSTLQYWMIQDSAFFSSQAALWFSQLPLPVLALASWGALAFEGTFWTVLIWPRLAALYVPAGVGFHLGIFATQRAAFFPYYALYACFVPVRRLLLAARARMTSEKPLVLYDGACFLCLRSMTILQFLDWFDRIDYVALQQDPLPRLGRVDATFRRRALEQIHVVEPDGSLHAGYAACRRLAWRLPLAWPVAPLLYLPGATAVGSFVYRRVAAARERFESCDGDTCGLHPRRQAR